MIRNQEVLVNTITELISLFKLVGDLEHIQRFEYIYNLARRAQSEAELKQVARDIKPIFGGMGSFNDLNYWTQENPNIEINLKLRTLKNKLYDDIVDIITM